MEGWWRGGEGRVAPSFWDSMPDVCVTQAETVQRAQEFVRVAARRNVLTEKIEARTKIVTVPLCLAPCTYDGATSWALACVLGRMRLVSPYRAECGGGGGWLDLSDARGDATPRDPLASRTAPFVPCRARRCGSNSPPTSYLPPFTWSISL